MYYIKNFLIRFSCKKLGLLVVWLLSCQQLMAQNQVLLTDFSFFQEPSSNWTLASAAGVDPGNFEMLTTKDGSGVLVNRPNKIGSKDLYTKASYGDMDLELDYMMVKGSNSGIFLQGRYEVQLFDSWGKLNPYSGDNGGIYERWDDSKPEGQQGYEGYAPRQNASRAPGLWQHMRISFQAPRFDTQGKKVSKAKIIYVWLNGVLIQDNVELSGPTRVAVDNSEVEAAPLRLQGDHGVVAFRNIKITSFDRQHPTISNLKYWVYKGAATMPLENKVKVENQGNSTLLSSNVSKLDNDFLIRYTGSIKILEAGDYTFNLSVPGGRGVFRIDGTEVITANYGGTGKIRLVPGDHMIDLNYAKTGDWAKSALGLTVASPGFREYLLSDANVSNGEPIDPIIINATSNIILRSFSDLPGGIRISHGVGVGSPEQVHYTYDLDKGMIVQIWRGSFLDATPMWHDRGDGSSRPIGSVQYLGKPVLSIEKLGNVQAAWATDTAGTGYKPKGYILNTNGQPTFKYLIYGSMVNDASTVIAGGQGIRREITVQNPVDGLFVHLASGTNIEDLGTGLFTVDDKSYYIRIEDAGSAAAILRNAEGKQELIIPIKTKITYSIIF